MKQELITDLSKEKKVILLKAYFQDEIMARSIIETLNPAELNKWLSENENEIDSKLRQESLASGKCAYCGKPLSFYTFNEGDNYSIECVNCDILYDED